jgi:DNA repair exonuclease SbcCD ATPase subunit
MTDACKVGKDNENNIQALKHKIKELELEIEYVKKNMVDAEAMHKVELKISELSAKFEEMKNNRIEDRKNMDEMRIKIDELSSNLEEHIEGNYKILSNQEISSQEQSRMKDDIIEIKDMIKGLGKEIENNNIWTQIKTFSDRSKLHKWLVRTVFTTIVMMFLASATFIFGGGLTLPNILEFLKGVVL